MGKAFHTLMPAGATETVKRSVWLECGCKQCASLLRRAGKDRRVLAQAAPGKENDLTKDVAAMLDTRLPLGSLFTHIPNGGYRTPRTAGLLRAMGTRPGFPDFEVGVPRVALFTIELKTVSGELDDEQEQWRDVLQLIPGVVWACCRSVDEVIAMLTLHGVALRPPGSAPLTPQTKSPPAFARRRAKSMGR